MVYGYCRVSTAAQLKGNSIEEQKTRVLEIYPEAEIIIEVYSGVKMRKEFERMLEATGEGDTVVATKLDRFCRSAKEGLEYIDRLLKKGVKIHIVNMGLIENNPIGRLITTTLLAYAELERSIIVDRTQAGKMIAKQNPNFREGRPKIYGKGQIEHALVLLKSHTYREVGNLTGISRSTLYRAKIKQELKNITDLEE